MSLKGRQYTIWLLGLVAALALLFSVVVRLQSLPHPNGHDDLVAIAARIPESVRELDRTNSAAFAVFAAEHPRLVEEVEHALKQPAAVPLNKGQEWVTDQVVEFMSIRCLEKALLALAHHRESTGDSLAAVRGRVAAVELGQQIARGGLLTHYFLSTAIQINGLTILSNSVPKMDRGACETSLRELNRLRHNLEPLGGYLRRERRWLLTGSGWWRDWETAMQIPRLLANPAEESFWGTPQKRATELSDRYLGLEAVLRTRLEQLSERPEAGPLP